MPLECGPPTTTRPGRRRRRGRVRSDESPEEEEGATTTTSGALLRPPSPPSRRPTEPSSSLFAADSRRRRRRRLGCGDEDGSDPGRSSASGVGTQSRRQFLLLVLMIIVASSQRCRSFQLFFAMAPIHRCGHRHRHRQLSHSLTDDGVRHRVRTSEASSSRRSARRRGDRRGGEEGVDGGGDDDGDGDDDEGGEGTEGSSPVRGPASTLDSIDATMTVPVAPAILPPNLSWVLRLEDTSRRLEGQVRHLTSAVQSLQRTVDRTARALAQAQALSRATSHADHDRPPSRGGRGLGRRNSSTTTTTTTTNTRRARLFIDGTWLYYSLYEREREMCPIARRFGRDWVFRYAIDWARIPAVVEAGLRQDGASFAPAGTLPPPPAPPSYAEVEIVSSTVFTSYKPDTAPASFRYKMFDGLRKAGFDVRMMETLGDTEKCVDIALAVELIHADCDVALILTGDKDFLPAMVRTRTATKELGLVSMRRSCNRALYETPTGPILDYGVVWLDDYVDQFVVPIAHGDGAGPARTLSVFTVIKILNDFIDRSPAGRVSSRDVGRYLKSLELDSSTTVSDEVKRGFGGLRHFVRLLPDVYRIVDADVEARDDRSFLIELVKETASQRLQMEAKRAVLSATERQFLDRYNLRPLDDGGSAYCHTSQLLMTDPGRDDSGTTDPSVPDYSTWTVARLKDLCRKRNLPVTGVKSVLVQRIAAGESDHRDSSRDQGRLVDGRGGVASAASQAPVDLASVPPSVSHYLQGLVIEYLTASGGQASSRDVGRYLVANKSSTGDERVSALQELKVYYSSVAQFIQTHSHTFKRGEAFSNDRRGRFAFPVSLVTDVDLESVDVLFRTQ